MKFLITLTFSILLLSSCIHDRQEDNKALVSRAIKELFIKRDTTAIKRYWSNQYLQHNPRFSDGSADLAHLISALPTNFKYEIGQIAANDNFVFVHGRYTGVAPKPIIAVDIYRVENGKLKEHWDVLQDEVPAKESKNGKQMLTDN
jgi:predicted SnoaL-like aldol condensation-catalyzing enzyme